MANLTFTFKNTGVEIENVQYTVVLNKAFIYGNIIGDTTVTWTISQVDETTVRLYKSQLPIANNLFTEDYLGGVIEIVGSDISIAATSENESSIYIANNVPYVPSPAGGSTFTIVTVDPSSPANGDSWLLEESTVGQAIGTLGVTSTGIYNLKVKTVSGIKKIKLI